MTTRGKLAALCTVFIMLGVPLGALEPGGTFTDDDGSPHEANIEALVVSGITNGCAPDRFCPEDPVDRGQMAAFLDRALDLPDAPPAPFTDTAGPFAAEIDRLYAADITTGCGPTTYCPNDTVTRGQMAAFLDRALDLPDAPPAPFTDTAGPFAAEIDRLYAADITTGCGPTTYCPNDTVTRAQMATFVTRALGLTPILVEPRPLPVAGNPNGTAFVPPAARAVDTSQPTTIIGTGSAASCTAQAVVDAVAAGGTITFDCGPDPVTIPMTQTARVFNNAIPDVVIDGGELVTLSGMGERRVLYMNTCDQSLVWTTPRCDNQDHPRLVLQNLTFIDGNSTGETIDGGGGGAVFVRGGRVRVVNSRFFSNRCASVGPDVGGGALRVLSQHNGQPVYVVGSTFGGRADLGNVCSNGGGTSSIGVSWVMINSLFSHNAAVGIGANPARSGTPGGGNGGGIYLDGNTMSLDVYDTVINDNVANEGGGAIFFVSNNRTGTMSITDSTLRSNPSLGFETRGLPGIFVLAAAPPTVVNSIIE
jgi:hypothetical protein